MKKRILFGATAASIAALAIVAAAVGSANRQAGPTVLPASSCGKLQYGGSGSPKFIIASDLPLQGASRALMVEMGKAVQFTIEQQGWKAGKYTIGYQACDDSTAQQGGWDSAKCSANAAAYARDQSVIGVIGTFNSGCAKLIIPVLNRAPNGPLAMMSPANTYPGLTTGGPGTAPGEPNIYYPTGKRNYARVVWTDQFQGAADAIFAKKTLKLKSVFILSDKQTYGQGISTLFRRAATKLRMKVSGFQGWDANATSYESIANSIKSTGAQGVFLGGIVCNNGGKLIKDLRAVLGPKFPIIIPDGWTPFSATGETSGGASDGAYISYAGIPVNALKGAGARFAAAFTKANSGKLPDPYTAYAAQAAQLLLNAIAKSDGTRASVTAGLFNVKVTNGILGNFTIGQDGDTTLGSVSIGRMTGKDAKFQELITPPLKFVKG